MKATGRIGLGVAPASAGVADRTSGLPGTLNAHPNDSTAVTVYPQLSARGPVDYAGYVLNVGFGCANYVLY